MNSLRARLILGFAVVAVVPLALALALLARHLRDTVRAQAAERLDTATAVLEEQFRADGERMTGRLAILARDPALKRAYLVRPAGGELEAYLEERRILLGLDYLALTDDAGEAVAAAAADSLPGAPPATHAGRAHGAVVVRPGGGGPALMMAASAPILYQGETTGRLTGGTLLGPAFLGRLGRGSGLELRLRDASGRDVVSTLAAGDAAGGRARGGQVEIAGRRYLARSFPIGGGPEPRPTLTALATTEGAESAIAGLQTTAWSLAIAGVGVAIVLGGLWSWNVSRPVEQLARFSQRIARGEWEEPLAVHSIRELDTLVTSLERMRRDLRAYRERLVASERHAAWSLMARQVAHEVRNPLTPIAVSIADLKRSYEQGRPDFPAILDQAVRTVGEEVQALKRMLQEFSEFGRLPRPDPAPCRLADLLGNVAALYAADASAGRLAVAPPARDVEMVADAGQLAQALVNLVQNGLEANAGRGTVRVTAATDGEVVEFEVRDDGPGLDEERRSRIFAPDFSTKERGSGLGLTIVERIATEHGGTVAVDSAPGRGAAFRLRIPIRPPAT